MRRFESRGQEPAYVELFRVGCLPEIAMNSDAWRLAAPISWQPMRSGQQFIPSKKLERNA
jgi:hypothetical protein